MGFLCPEPKNPIDELLDFWDFGGDGVDDWKMNLISVRFKTPIYKFVANKDAVAI